MKQAKTINGKELRGMMETATNWLEKSASDIDALNVFPVPDGDTGTNMLLTMRSCVEEAYRTPDSSVPAIAQAIARGALLGARGNSGVILSQIWRANARSCDMYRKDILYFFTRSAIRFRMSALMDTSNIDTGSSATTNSGLRTNARATATLCLWPPLSS